MADLPKNRIAELRKEKGLTLKALGKAVGMRDNTLSQYETGKREPKLETWQKLAEFFDVSVEYVQGISKYKTMQDWAESALSLASQQILDGKTAVEWIRQQQKTKNQKSLFNFNLMFNDSLTSMPDTRKIGMYNDIESYAKVLKILNYRTSKTTPEEIEQQQKIYDKLIKITGIMDAYLSHLTPTPIDSDNTSKREEYIAYLKKLDTSLTEFSKLLDHKVD